MQSASNNMPSYYGPLRGARALILDDETLTVRAIERVLRGCGARTVCCTRIETARAEVEEGLLPFDVAVIDYQLVEGFGIEIIQLLRTGRYPCSTLMITGSHDPELGRRAIQAGAEDFLLKPFDVVKFVHVLEELVGRTHERRRRIASTPIDPSRRSAPPFLQSSPMEHLRTTGPGVPTTRAEVPGLLVQAERIAEDAKLSKREREVLLEMLRGKRNYEISADLGITVRTVKFHVHNVLKKCGVEGRPGLMALLWTNDR